MSKEFSNKNKFSITYEIVTEESAEDGEAEERGWIDEGGYRVEESEGEFIFFSFDLAVKYCTGYGARKKVQSGGEDLGGSITFDKTNDGTSEFYRGKTESRTLHFPKNITDASRARVYKFLGVHQRSNNGNSRSGKA